MSHLTISYQHSIYILAAVLITAIALFITGFYSGTLMSVHTLKSVVSNVQSSEVIISDGAKITTAQLEPPEVLSELTEKEPPGAGAASDKVPISESPANKDIVDTGTVEDVDIAEDNTKIAIANNVTQGDFGTANEVTGNELTEDSAKHHALVENSAKVNNKSNNTNLLYTIQVGSFSKESNALKFNGLLATKGYNTRTVVSMSSNKTPVKKYKVYIGFFASQDTAIKEAYVYTIKEKLSSYVVLSHTWKISNNKINKAGLDNKGVYINYASIKQAELGSELGSVSN